MFFHIAAAATASGSLAPPFLAFAATSLNFLPGFPMSPPFLAFLTTSDLFFFVSPADGFFFRLIPLLLHRHMHHLTHLSF